ncbi:MAG: helix-turn-helix transcriptional regulator [Phycisphaerae bacterium]|nr:helix-turn-helix transcriptional regulator [Phycisphaerae bacterium]
MAVLAELGDRLSRLRLQRNLTQAKLAREAGVSKRTLIRLEGGESSQVTNLIRVIRALGLLGTLDGLVPPPPLSPIEQLRSRARERRRASPGTKASMPSTKWAWGDESSKAGGEP